MSTDRKIRIGNGLILIGALALAALLVMQGPIPQDTAYHNFADNRPWLGIPNAWNVLSNLAFVLVGLLGLYRMRQTANAGTVQANRWAWLSFFGSVALVGLGSVYYHWSPDSHSLFWDRLPMTTGFMALSAIVIGEFVSTRLGRLALWPLILLGLSSVLYWRHTELLGLGDLRFYVFVQAFPLFGIAVVLLSRPSPTGRKTAYWLLLGSYVLAKVAEHLDLEISS